MNLAELFPPGTPFTLMGISDGGTRVTVWNPAGHAQDFRVSGSLAAQLAAAGEPEPDDLPFVSTLQKVDGEWCFAHLGSLEDFELAAAPRPIPVEELHAGQEAQVRESLGLGPDEPIPVPDGSLPPSERPEEPLRFDPTAHMDLSTAEPAVPLPPPAPAKAEIAPDAHFAPPNPVPEPGVIDNKIPPDAETFVH